MAGILGSARPLRALPLLTGLGLLSLSLAGCSASGPRANATSAAPATSARQTAATLQGQFESVISKVAPSVVLIQTSAGLGSGVIYNASGDIVTNAHVVGSSTRFQVLLSNGKSYAGRLVGTFAADDLAVIKISGSGFHAATFGDSARVKVGEIVLAIGNPLGLQSSVTNGIVSAVGRSVIEPGGNALPPAIQTSAAINPGNSGGALVDLSGNVIGIPTLAATDPQMGGAAPGIGFVIPSQVAKQIADQLIASGKVTNTHRAALGITAAELAGAGGVLVYAVQPGGPAAKAGIRPDDIITGVDGRPTPDTATLGEVLAGLNPGQSVKVDVTHPDGSTAKVSVTLGELPASG